MLKTLAKLTFGVAALAAAASFGTFAKPCLWQCPLVRGN